MASEEARLGGLIGGGPQNEVGIVFLAFGSVVESIVNSSALARIPSASFLYYASTICCSCLLLGMHQFLTLIFHSFTLSSFQTNLNPIVQV